MTSIPIAAHTAPTRDALRRATGAAAAVGRRRLRTVDDTSWRELVAAPAAIISLSVSTCPACATWAKDLRAWLSDAELPQEVRVGTVTLDSPATAGFKRANEWLDEVTALPWTAVFVNGTIATSFAGGGVHRLERRLERLGLITSSGSGDPRRTKRAGDASPPLAHREHRKD
jgi:hypothetical protein